MTLSKDDRLRDMGKALELMTAALGDQALYTVEFDADEPPFNEIQPTTWKELQDRYLIERNVGWGDRYSLTGYGWRLCMEASGKLEDPEFRQKMSKLAAALKDEIKGRQQEGLVHAESLANGAGLPLDFVYNAIESQLLDNAFGIEGASWSEYGRHGMYISIPIDFGHKPL